MADNTQAWLLESDGRYIRATPGEEAPQSAQDTLLAKLRNAATITPMLSPIRSTLRDSQQDG